MKTVMIVAAEVSSTLYAQRLLELWQREDQKVEAFGVGSSEMENLGFERFGKAEEMAVMGFAEVLSHYQKIRKIFWVLVEEVKKRRPQMVILMDYPGFNLLMAKEMYKLSIPVVYYISPQIWAWKKKRIHKIRKYCDQVLVLFPFEKEFYQKEGVPVQWVGHPLLDEIDPKFYSRQYKNYKRARYGILENDYVLGIMPGSRKGELDRLFSTQIEICNRLHKNYPRIKIMLLTAPNIEMEEFKRRLEGENLDFSLILVKDQPLEMIVQCDLILATSGTATLMVGLLDVPMVVMYKFQWLSGKLAKLLVRGVRFFGIVNLIFNEEVVPERWQEKCTSEVLYPLLVKYIEEPSYYKQVREKLKELKNLLGDQGATQRVAKILDLYFLETKGKEIDYVGNRNEKKKSTLRTRNGRMGANWIVMIRPLLLIVSPLYLFGTYIRNILFEWNWIKKVELGTSVISIGNLTLGGTGKTPFISWLVDKLKGAKNKKGQSLKVVTIHRNYKAKVREIQKVFLMDEELLQTYSQQLRDGPRENYLKTQTNQSIKDALFFGDEPYLLATLHPHLNVYVGSKKWETAIYAQKKENPDLILIDDGFQHRKLGRDWDIVLLDARRLFREEFLIFPLGRGRESFSSIKRARWVVFTKCSEHTKNNQIEYERRIKKINPTAKFMEMEYHLKVSTKLESLLKSRERIKVLAFAGIAQPEAFEVELRKMQFVQVVRLIKFPDHYEYTERDIQNILNQKEKLNAKIVVTTEKDGVKIRNFPMSKEIEILALELIITKGESEFYEDLVQSFGLLF